MTCNPILVNWAVALSTKKGKTVFSLYIDIGPRSMVANISPILTDSGIAGAAVVSALFAAPDIAKAAATLKQQMEEITGGATL